MNVDDERDKCATLLAALPDSAIFETFEMLIRVAEFYGLRADPAPSDEKPDA